jgi:Family of unknown function (DUF6375)
MKIWNSYGSEHSMNLVMIGQFKTADDAERTKQSIDLFTRELADEIEVGRSRDRFGNKVLDLLNKAECHILSPSDLEQFLYEVDSRVDEDKIIITTDESDISAFMKLMIHNGAKIEVFSAHDYPELEKSIDK